MPCYQSESYVANMIDDVLSQTYTNLELIIVSNGKNQNAQLDIIKRFAQGDERIVVICVDDGGVSNARNIGMKQVSGTWVTFVDADDRLDNNHLELFVDRVSDDVDLIVGGFTQIRTKEGLVCSNRIDSIFSFGEDFLEQPSLVLGSVCNKLFRIGTLREFGGKQDSHLTYKEDALFCLGFIRFTQRIAILPMSGYRYICVDDQSASSKYQACMNDGDKKMEIAMVQLYQIAGASNEKIQSYLLKSRYFNSYFEVCNLFKKGSPFSFQEKYKEIDRLIYNNPQVCEAIDIWRKKENSLFLRIYNTCYITHSAWIMAMAFEIQYWAKYHFMGFYLKVVKYLRK